MLKPKDRSPLRRWAFPLVLLFGLIGAGCSPDYSQPDHDGNPPQGRPDWAVTVVSDEILPDAEAIPCGQVRSVHLSLSQSPVACPGYDFTLLKARAKALVDLRTSQILCQGEGCTIKQAYYTYWKLSCAANKATVEVKAKVRCLDSPAPLPPNVGSGAGMAMTTAGVTAVQGGGGSVVPSPLKPPSKGEILIVDGTQPITAPMVLCGQKIKVSLTYRRKTSTGGPPLMGYQSYVDEAKARAELIHTSFICQPPCHKLPFRPVHTDWSLTAPDLVVVTVDFEVECRP